MGIVVAAVVVGLVAVPRVEAGAIDEPCGDVTLAFARGSSQGLGEREATKYFESIKERLGSGISVHRYELGAEDLGGTHYRAVGVTGSLQSYKNLLEADASWTGGLGGEYRKSVSEGVTELKSYLSQRSAKCGGEVFVVGGYSQGAQVVGEALFAISSSVRSKIAFVSLFGDPKLYLPEGRGPFPPACRGKEFSPWRRGSVSCWTDNGVLEARDPYLPADIEHRVGSWCDRNDTICNNNLADLVHPDHGQYADDGAEMDEAVREIAGALQDRLPDKADEIDTSIFVFGLGTAGLDVAFVIDTTGSMAGSIGAAEAIAETVGESIVALRGRVALTEYRDAGDPVVAQVVTPLTTEIENFRSGLGSLYASGGGDTPEALLYALMTTLNGLDWKSGATKAAVVLTDAGYHDPDLAAGYTLADVAQRALEIDPVSVFPVVPYYATGEYQALAEQTSGQVVSDEGDTEAALLEAVGEIETRPVALLVSGDYFATPGEEVAFDASPSYDSDSEIESYEWDFDGDGWFDAETESPVISHTYADAYEGLMEVRVNSADGGTANAVANVHVDEEGVAGAPSAPRNLSATSAEEEEGTRRITLRWEPNDASETIDGWVIRRGDGQVLAHRTAEQWSLAVAGVPQQPETFTVAALNEYGEGSSAGITVVPDAVISQGQPPGNNTLQPTHRMRILHLSLWRRRFEAAHVGGPVLPRGKRSRIGTTVRYRLSDAGAVDFTVKRRRHAVGRFSAKGEGGLNAFRFSGRVSGRTLSPGHYVLIARPDGGGGAGWKVGFTVVRPARTPSRKAWSR